MSDNKSALGELRNKEPKTDLDQVVVWFSESIEGEWVDESITDAVECAAAELARLQAIERAARELLKAHDKEVNHGYVATWDGLPKWFVFDEHGRDKALNALAAALGQK
jgi:hypothetical protein